MSKKKYSKGEKINSLDELVSQELIYVDMKGWKKKIRHISVIKSFQFDTAIKFMPHFYKVKKVEDDK